MKIALYQIIPEFDTDRLMFNNFDYMHAAYGKELPAHLYEQVFCGEVEANYLEIVFAIFNTNFPKDYRGRSMSVSDVLEVVETSQKSKFYYCDSVGFKEVEFDKNKAMLPIQNHDFQNTLIIKQNMRIFFVGENGLEDHFCDKIVLQRCRYSQCQIGYELQMYRGNTNKYITRQFLTKPLFVLTKCNLKMPDSVLYNIKDKDGMIIKKSRFSMHSLDILGAVSTWIMRSGFTFENM